MEILQIALQQSINIFPKMTIFELFKRLNIQQLFITHSKDFKNDSFYNMLHIWDKDELHCNWKQVLNK